MCFLLCVQVVASGVCHSDWVYLYECGKRMRPRPFPVVLGHEGAGVVEIGRAHV